MSHYKSEVLAFSQCNCCLPSNGVYEPCCGKIVELPSHVKPNDIPNPLLDTYADQFNLQPEHVMARFLEANPNFANPRDMGRILYFSQNISPFAISFILFNSQYSSQALTFSFMSAIDMDCLSIDDAMRYILQKVAVPNWTIPIVHFATAFASAYGLRNKLEWPNLKIIQDLFCAAICFSFKGGEFSDYVKRFTSLGSVNERILEQIGNSLKERPPAIFFSSISMMTDNCVVLSDTFEQEGRYRSSWKKGHYKKEGNLISFKDAKDKEQGQIPIIQYILPDGSKVDKISNEMIVKSTYAIARQRIGVPKKPNCFTLSMDDNSEFGMKVKKDGTTKPSSRTAYTFSFEREDVMQRWLSVINYQYVYDELDKLN